MKFMRCETLGSARLLKWVAVGVLASVALLFATNSVRYLYLVLPYLLLLACPLMHLLHHRGHRAQQHGQKENNAADAQDAAHQR